MNVRIYFSDITKMFSKLTFQRCFKINNIKSATTLPRSLEFTEMSSTRKLVELKARKLIKPTEINVSKAASDVTPNKKRKTSIKQLKINNQFNKNLMPSKNLNKCRIRFNDVEEIQKVNNFCTFMSQFKSCSYNVTI